MTMKESTLMALNDLTKRANEIRTLFKRHEELTHGRAWTREEIMLGLVGDTGDLAKLVMAKEGIRDIPDHDAKLKHELSDCLWSILVLAEEYKIDLEKEFFATMDSIEKKLKT